MKNQLLLFLDTSKSNYLELNTTYANKLTIDVMQNANRAFKNDIPNQINNIISLINRCNLGWEYNNINNIDEAYSVINSEKFEESIIKVKQNSEISSIGLLKPKELNTTGILDEIMFQIRASADALSISLALAKMQKDLY